jgi:hypothetical protein
MSQLKLVYPLRSFRRDVDDGADPFRIQRALDQRRFGFSDGAFDNMPLNPSAMWAGKDSQVLAQRARLDRRQLHRRTASRALRTLILRVEHYVAPLSSAL